MQITVGFDGRKVEPESNVLLASIENMQYAVTLDVLHMVHIHFDQWFLTFSINHFVLNIDSLDFYWPGFFCFWTYPKDCDV